MNQIMHQKQIDVSNGTIKNEPNNAMQPASQTTESPAPAKKSPLKRQGIGAKAIIAIIAVVALLTPISAFAAGKIVVFIIGWTAGQTLTEAKEAAKKKFLNAKSANTSVNGADWRSNSYSYKLTMGDDVASSPWAYWFLAPVGYRNVKASQGDYWFGTASGSRDGVAMEEEGAESLLEEQARYTKIYWSGYAVNDDEHRVLVMGLTAREDTFSGVKSETLAKLRKARDDDSYEWDDGLWVKHTYKRHVGNHMMRSYYRDPNLPDKIEVLATPGPEETQNYIGTVQWTKYSVDCLGNKVDREVKDMEVEFLAYKSSRRSRKLCDSNQIIEMPHISANVTRQIEKRS